MKTDSSKSTILVISMGFLVLYLGLAIKWMLILSLIIGIIGISSTYLSHKIEWAWMKLSKVLGFIVPNIIISLLFFLILFPIALLSKLSRKDPLMLSSKYNSYFININKELDKKSFEKIW
jgi:hypothetical protein